MKINNKYLIIFNFIIFFIIFYKNKIFIIFQNENGFKYNLNESLSEASTRSHNFVLKANRGILIKKIPKKITKNPEISVVIPVFNTENFVHRAILSIQNQNFSDFEIIIINDCSTDNSFNILSKLSVQDKRIKIINNTKNMGLLYSRCIGTLKSKGKYIFPLDSDDMYLIHDTLFSVYNEVKKNKPDLLQFRGILSQNIESFFEKKNLELFRDYIKKNLIVNQPTLANNSYKLCSLQAYSIESNLYKKAIRLLGKNDLYAHISYYEDCITNYIIHQYAKSEELYLKIGYLYIYRESSNSHTEYYINKLKSEIYYTQTIFKYSIIETKNKVFATNDLVSFIKRQNMTILLQDEKIKKYLNWIIKKIMLDKFISNKHKKFIKIFWYKSYNKTF